MPLDADVLHLIGNATSHNLQKNLHFADIVDVEIDVMIDPARKSWFSQ